MVDLTFNLKHFLHERRDVYPRVSRNSFKCKNLINHFNGYNKHIYLYI